jgi:hypothetical protein
MEESPSFELVTKLEAAERQLRVAIRLFFERKDMIAVHTLTAAALEILRELGRPRGFKSLFEHAGESIRPEKRREVLNIVREAQNFFKHAGRDLRKELKFYHTATPLFMFDAVKLEHKLTGYLSAESTVFLAWYAFKNPAIFLDHEAVPQAVAELAKVVNLDDFEAFLFLIDHYPKTKGDGL